jgi:hypothetical protein
MATKRVVLQVDEAKLAEIDRIAESAHLSRTEFIVTAALQESNSPRAPSDPRLNSGAANPRLFRSFSKAEQIGPGWPKK